MPAEQRGEPFAVKGGYGLRYYDLEGKRRRFTPSPPFPTKTAARAHYREVVGPKLHGLAHAQQLESTFGQLVERYLRVHGATRSPRTITILRERLGYATELWEDRPLEQLSPGEIADWTATLPERSRYGIVQALRQTLEAAVRWQLIPTNPAKLAGPNPQPRAEEIQPLATEEVDAIAVELGAEWGPLVVFAAETGLRPSEWIALERKDIRKDEGVVLVERSYAYGRLNAYGKTAASRRRVPLSSRALEALEAQPRRLDTRLVFPAEKGGYVDLHNWRARDWHPALEAAGIARRRPYDLRHTYATHALAAGLTLYEVARYMGTSVAMIDRTYGHLAAGSEGRARILLDAYSARMGQERATDAGGITP